jgi:hypothetical protein
VVGVIASVRKAPGSKRGFLTVASLWRCKFGSR